MRHILSAFGNAGALFASAAFWRTRRSCPFSDLSSRAERPDFLFRAEFRRVGSRSRGICFVLSALCFLFSTFHFLLCSCLLIAGRRSLVTFPEASASPETASPECFAKNIRGHAGLFVTRKQLLLRHHFARQFAHHHVAYLIAFLHGIQHGISRPVVLDEMVMALASIWSNAA